MSEMPSGKTANSLNELLFLNFKIIIIIDIRLLFYSFYSPT